MSKHKLLNAENLARSASRRAKRWRLARVGIVFCLIVAATMSGWAALRPLSATRSATAETLAAEEDASSDSEKADQQRYRDSGRKSNNATNRKNSSNNSKKTAAGSTASKPGATGSTGATAAVAGKAATSSVTPPASVPANSHTGISTTIFWAGEAADASNANISNTPSAWDDIWSTHFGGYDDPDHRTGWYPSAFTPKENPFYFALPYNDYDANGNRRADASKCTAITGVKSSSTSWCKNAWIKITKSGKTVYAQWQDVGPMNEDDSAYVFGTAAPKNTWGGKAGLDVSPAVRDYLKLQDVDKTDWSFVSASAVPAGPWKNIVTTSDVYWP